MKNKRFLITFNILLIIFGILFEPNISILFNLIKIINGSDALITDYFIKGSIGSTFLNAGSVGLLSTILLSKFKKDFIGIDFAAIMLMSGFSFMGKNIFNVWPIIFGTYIYTKVNKVAFKDYLPTAYFSSALGPIVSQFTFVNQFNLIEMLVGLCLSILAGFLIPTIAKHARKLHKGYNLYNVGFSAGIISTIYVFVIHLFNYEIKRELLYYYEINYLSYLTIIIVSLSLIVYAYLKDKKSLITYQNLLKTSGHNIDYLTTYNFETVMINTSMNMLITTFILITFKIPINGPIICGLLTIAGFSAYGKHLRNITPIYLGVILFTLLSKYNLSDPGVSLSMLFLTGLAPFVGQYGIILGIIAGMLNIALALNTSVLHAGLNLYNTGFSIGILLMVILPVIDLLKKFMQFNSRKCKTSKKDNTI